MGTAASKKVKSKSPAANQKATSPKTEKVLSTNSLNEESLSGRDPIAIFTSWMQEAFQAGVVEPFIMNLATVGPDGRPTVRVVSLGGVNKEGFEFATSSSTKKAADLEATPFAAVSFYWYELQRTVRVEGKTEKLSVDHMGAYKSWPKPIQISVQVSDQSSHPVDDWEREEQRYKKIAEKYENVDEIPKPDFIDTYRIVPDRMQFMQHNNDNLADRFLFSKDNDDVWSFKRINP